MKLFKTQIVGCAFCLATAATAQPPGYVGYWSENAAWCQNAGDVGEETPDLFEEHDIFGLEWSCEITKSTEIGVGQSWRIETSCLDAGFAYKESSIFMITATDRLLVLSEQGETTDLIRCPQIPD